jgi:hypothetical protein
VVESCSTSPPRTRVAPLVPIEREPDQDGSVVVAMAQFIAIGECLGVTEEQRGQGDKAFTLTKMHIVHGVDKIEVEKSKNYVGALPSRGEVVAVVCQVNAWSTQNGSKGLNITGLRRDDDIEELLAKRYAG